MSQEFYQKLEKLLKQDKRFLDQEGDLLKSNIVNLAYKADRGLIELLLSKKEFKDKFFSKVKDVSVFNINDFVAYIQDKNFLADSYTKYRNKIGLNIDEKFLNERKEVALIWPFKDCVLEGGMTKEDEKRKEIFFNEILAQDEIDKLFAPKVLINWRRYSQKGEEKVRELKRDKDGIIRENLILKGNNLLALYSLKEQFQNKIKMIYIDPPYNMGDDSFGYNDNFNHSSWLTFMKNRIETAKELLSNDGAIFIQIDHHEVGYLQILLDEIFGPENKVQIITIKTSSPAGFKTVNPGPIEVTEYILFYTKNKKEYKFKRGYVPVDYDENYNLVIINKNERPENWKIESLINIIYEENNIEIGKTPQQSSKNAEKVWGPFWKIIRKQMMAEYALRNADRVVSIRDPHNPSAKLKDLLIKSRNHRDKIFIYEKNNNGVNLEQGYVINRGALAFYSNKVQNIDGFKQPTELLTDLWVDLRWDGIAGEGGVKLKNGKKPEKLIQRIIEIATDDDDIILDFFLGSGTTAAVAHKMGKQYIGIEQLDYGEDDAVVRLQNVIGGKKKVKGKLLEDVEYDQLGISKAVGWKGGGDFVYCELMKYNEQFVEEIQKADTTRKFLNIWEEMKVKSFLNYNVDIQKFNQTIDEFKAFPIAKQKHVLLSLLNKNQLYVNLSEIEDGEFKVSIEDKKINKEFFG